MKLALFLIEMWTFRNFAKKEVFHKDLQVTSKSSGAALFQKVFDGNLGPKFRSTFC